MTLRKRLHQNRRWIASTTLVVALVALLALLVDWKLVLVQLALARWDLLALASLLLVAGYVVYAWRWQLMLNGRAGFMPVFHTSNIGNMANTLLPLRPGDAMRVFILRGATGLSLFQITSSLVVERWYEQIMRLAAFGGALVFGAGMAVSRLTIVGMLAFLAASWVLMIWMVRKRERVLESWPPVLARLPRVTEETAYHGLSHLIEGFTSLSSPARMLEALLSSVMTWGLFWGFHYLCLIALNPSISTSEALAISLGSLALCPPSATTLPGLYQVSIVIPMVVLGYNSNLLTSYTVIMNLLEMVVINGLGVWGAMAIGVSLNTLFRHARPEPEPEPEAPLSG